MVEPTVCTYHALKNEFSVLGTEDLWIFWMISKWFQATHIPLESMWNHLEPWKKPFFIKQITVRDWITLFLEPRYILPALVCLLSTLTFYLKAWKGLRVRTFCSFSKIIKKVKVMCLMHKTLSYEIFDAYLCCTAIGSFVYFENVE